AMYVSFMSMYGKPLPLPSFPTRRSSDLRDLEILTAIGEGHPLTQRVLAQRLGVALGLTNLYLKRLAQKGLIKIAEFPRKPHARRSEEHTSELQSRVDLVCRLLLEKKKKT